MIENLIGNYQVRDKFGKKLVKYGKSAILIIPSNDSGDIVIFSTNTSIIEEIFYTHIL